ncbi:MAG TPA: hypothetical protein VD837_08925 [Terriglobales bacterium]|nr:hypothetical protein [Terriglobales bacterium]
MRTLVLVAAILTAWSFSLGQDEEDKPEPPGIYRNAACGFQVTYPGGFSYQEPSDVECGLRIYEPWEDTHVQYRPVQGTFAQMAAQNGFSAKGQGWRLRSSNTSDTPAAYYRNSDIMAVFGIRGKRVGGEQEVEEESVAVICDRVSRCLVMTGYVADRKILPLLVGSVKFFAPNKAARRSDD